jgi:hypothetical protein
MQTGVEMEHNYVIRFRNCILNGQFEELFQKNIIAHKNLKSGSKCVSIFDQVTQNLPAQKKQLIMYYTYEQWYSELIE